MCAAATPETALADCHQVHAESARAFGRLFVAGKAAKAAEARAVTERLGKAHIRQIMPSGEQSALNIERGGQAFSPMAEG
jgi:hypothetical protein